MHWKLNLTSFKCVYRLINNYNLILYTHCTFIIDKLLNPLLIMIFIPIYELFIYPLLSSVGIKRPLQKLTLGGILAGLAFLVSGIVELNIQVSFPHLNE